MQQKASGDARKERESPPPGKPPFSEGAADESGPRDGQNERHDRIDPSGRQAQESERGVAPLDRGPSDQQQQAEHHRGRLVL